MRPARFQEFTVKALAEAPYIRTVEPVNEPGERPHGLEITFTNGAQLQVGITYARADGEKFEDADGTPVAESPVEGEPPAAVPWPELPSTGRREPRDLEPYLVSALVNSGNAEIASVYGYSDREAPAKYPGAGVRFHNGSRIFMFFE
ncbi:MULTISPECIES: hypothetical protein [Streptomyces]|uniref:Uncharacterized protein n=1 Tax=Streptomyces luteosporeus TaxID=173856 RepID=A0ABP6G4S1_9ACTN